MARADDDPVEIEPGLDWETVDGGGGQVAGRPGGRARDEEPGQAVAGQSVPSAEREAISPRNPLGAYTVSTSDVKSKYTFSTLMSDGLRVVACYLVVCSRPQ